MTLREWLDSVGKTGAWLASELKVTHQAVYAWINGQAFPRGALLARIEEISEGRVTARTLQGGGQDAAP